MDKQAELYNIQLNKHEENKEWKYIVCETHSEQPTKENNIKREMLMYMQILFSQANYRDYMIMKSAYMYCKNT
jgi:hypothetical protein